MEHQLHMTISAANVWAFKSFVLELQTVTVAFALIKMKPLVYQQYQNFQ